MTMMFATLSAIRTPLPAAPSAEVVTSIMPACSVRYIMKRHDPCRMFNELSVYGIAYMWYAKAMTLTKILPTIWIIEPASKMCRSEQTFKTCSNLQRQRKKEK